MAQRRQQHGPGLSDALYWALVVTLALLAAGPLWGPGIVNTRGGGDSPFLLQRTMEMAENLRYGIFPPRWMAHAAYDLGYPFFNHYAALPYYLSGALAALGINILTAIQATQTFGFLLAAVTMSLWSRRIFRSRAAQLLAVAAYTFAPFHLVNVYVRGDSLSEFYAFVWYPLILWALDQAAKRPASATVLGGALAYGALILTHNVSALIFSPFALLYGLAAASQPGSSEPARPHRLGTRARSVLAVGAVFVTGILLSAWFWMPAVLETRSVQLGPAFTEGYFHYTNHFRGLNLVQPTLLFDYSVATDASKAGPFAMGLPQAVLALAGSVLLVVHLLTGKQTVSDANQSSERRPWWVLLASLILASFMITPLSKPLWDTLPLLETTQFPWRFLSVQALFTAILAGAIAEPALWPQQIKLPARRALAYAASGLCALLIVGAGLASLRLDRLLITPRDVTWENLWLYESFTGNIGTTIRYEWLPQDVVPRPYISGAVIDGAVQPIPDGDASLTARLTARSPNRQVWQVDLLEGPAAVAFPVHWWPGWRAAISGAPADAYPLPGSGWLAVTLTPGSHTVTLRLQATPLQRLAVAVSAAAILAAVGVAAAQADSRRIVARGAARVAAVALGGLLLALIGPALLQRPADAPAVFFDFDQMPYPHQGPVDFGQARLLSASIQADGAPGQVVGVDLDWELLTADSLTATVRLVTAAEPRYGLNTAIAGVSAPVAPATTLRLSLPGDLSRGLYLLQLRLHNSDGEIQARTAQGNVTGPVYIGSLRVAQGAPRPAEPPPLAVFGELTLHAVEAEQTSPDSLPLRMSWSTSGTPRNWRLSLRLHDLDGNLVVQQDTQPGYDYLPTTLWHPGEMVVDYLRLPLPEGLAPGIYNLTVVTYLQHSMEGGGEAAVPVQLTAPTLRDPHGATILCQTAEVALLRLDAPSTISEGESLALQAEWSALLAPAEDVQAAWTLAAPGGSAAVTHTAPLAAGSATSSWPRHTWVLAPVSIALPSPLPEDAYDLSLVLEGEDSAPVDCGVVATVRVESRARSFTIPPIPHPQTATFGETIRLLGYALDENRQTRELQLTVWWQAARTPERDYTRFVHLYDPETEQLVAQDDAMPRGWTYPTSLWVEGEVISETITLSLAEVPPGTYRVGVGWYAPEDLSRLTATEAAADLVSENRVTLEVPVRHP